MLLLLTVAGISWTTIDEDYDRDYDGLSWISIVDSTYALCCCCDIDVVVVKGVIDDDWWQEDEDEEEAGEGDDYSFGFFYIPGRLSGTGPVVAPPVVDYVCVTGGRSRPSALDVAGCDVQRGVRIVALFVGRRLHTRRDVRLERLTAPR